MRVLAALRGASEDTRLAQHQFKRAEIRDARLEQVEPHEGREEQEAGVHEVAEGDGQHREQAGDANLESAVAHIWQGRSDRYSELRAHLPNDNGPREGEPSPRRVEMSYIGG